MILEKDFRCRAGSSDFSDEQAGAIIRTALSLAARLKEPVLALLGRRGASDEADIAGRGFFRIM